MWENFGINNGAKGEVVDFIYKDEYIPSSGNIPESVFVNFCRLYDDIESFLS